MGKGLKGQHLISYQPKRLKNTRKAFAPYIWDMAEKKKKGGYYIIPWALSAAFLIRAMLLRDRPDTYSGEETTIWTSPTFYFVLSAVGFIAGIYFLQIAPKNKSD